MRPYEDVFYDDYPFALAHPARLRAVGQLLGLAPSRRPVRVLDLGCGLGGHLIAAAESDPASQYLGVDLSAPQIAAGQATIASLGLDNVTLRVADVCEMPADIGRFDVITCHGVYSWVPKAARAAIWQICRRHLAPGGLAFISANMNPGWLSRGVIRQTLVRSIQPSEATSEAAVVVIARQVLRHWIATLSNKATPSVVGLLEDLLQLQTMSDSYLLYEYLAPINKAFWFEDLYADATDAGLSYVADAQMNMNYPAMPKPTADWIAQRHPSVLGAEAATDLFVNRLFRRSLWTHHEARFDPQLHWRRLQGLWLHARLRPHLHLPATWTTPDGTEVQAPSRAAAAVISHLVAAAPSPISFDELCVRCAVGEPTTAQKADFGGIVLPLICADVIECRTHFPPIADRVSPLGAMVTPLARLQASRGDSGAVNLLHQRFTLSPSDRAVLQRLDGSHSERELRACLGPDPESLAEADRVLLRLRDAAFLMQPEPS